MVYVVWRTEIVCYRVRGVANRGSVVRGVVFVV